jgi:hypothetical protein
MRRLPFSRPESAGPSSARPRRVRPDQIETLAAQARGAGAVDPVVDGLIRLVNVTRMWKHWHKPVLIVVSPDAPQHYAGLREAFRGVPWADVVIDRRHRTATAEGLRPWAIVHADRVEMDAAPPRSPRSRPHPLRALPRLLRWTWDTGRRIGEHAAEQTFALARG